MSNLGIGMENEVLFLIYQYLSQCTSCNQTSVSLKQEMEEQGLLGTIVRWDGSTRVASLNDLQMKYKRIQPNEIVRLLNSTVPSGSTKKMSLLYQAKQIPANRNIFEEIKSIQTKIVDLTLSISKNSRIIATNKSKISKEQSTPDFEPNQSILLSMESLNPNQGSLFVDDQDVVNTLRSIGRLKNAKLLETQNQERSKENEVMALEKHNLSSYLWTSYPHHFTRGLYGEIDNAVDWLTSRSYGRQRYGMITTASFNLPRELASDEGSLTLNPHHSVDQSIMDQYHFLWSSSGHLLHPAYCSIFDRTGRFLITGADDYLVKIWDTETGQLVKTCRGHGGHVTVIAVSHDNSIMATACTSGSVRIWRLSDGKCLALMEHTGVVNWLQFDLLTGALISAGDDGQCIVWDLTCYIPFDKTDCFSDPSEYEEGGRRWWVGEIPITSCPLLKCCLESSSQKLSSPDQTPLRCGTFSWNMHDVTRNKLGCLSLPHVKDGLSGEPIKIFTFDICPRDNILATGCEDGIARIWRFDQKVFDETAIGSDSEKRSENLTKLEKMRGILSALDYSKFETTTLYLLFRLEGHMDEVTDLKFSNVGDRLCSGSMKDGTVRIWAFSKDYLRNEMLLLDLNENQQEDSDLHGQSSGGLSRHRNQINYKTEIYNIAWSCDDQMIFVVHSKVPKKLTRIHSHQISTKLSVFNSVAGTLLNSFTISERKSHVLAAHPLNPSIVFTGGEDGYMNIWNVERGVIISQHQLLSPPNITEIMESNLPVDILDASFSPDGLRIAVTDSIGRAILLGRDNPEKFKNVFPEQYFSTDYAVVVHDDHGWPIDEGTQLPIHLAPVGPLVNINHTQYPIQPKFSSFAFPQPLPFNLIVRMRKEILDDRPHWNRTIHHSYLAIRKHKNRLSQGNQSSQTNKNHSIWGHKSTSVQRSVTTSSLFRERRRHAIIVSDDEGEPPPEEDVFYQFSDSDESHFENDHNIRRSQRNRMIVSSRGRRLGTRRGDSESQIRTRAARAISRRVNREVDMDVEALSEDDTEESVANISEENDDEKPEDEKKLTRRVDRKKKDREETLSLAYSSWMTVRSKGKYHRIIPIGTLIERDWLLLDSPSDHEYCPQVGDKVMYFPQGHINHLNLLPEQRRPPWMSFPMKWPVVECRIISISYDFPTHSEYNKCPSILAKLQLQLIGRPLRWGNNCHPGQIYSSFGPLRESRNTTPQDIIFEVTLRHSTLPDFLVPSYLYYRCSIINWQPSVEFVSYFLEYQDDQSTVYKDYKGIVCRVTDSDTRDWIHSPWESLEIQWINSSDVNTQGGDYERISPWDAILPEMTYPSKHFYSNSLNPEFQKNILDCINLLMIEEDYQAFSYPVDPTFFPDYDCIIPVPMYLDLIKRRLENNFYRQMESLQADVYLLLSNCEMYNVDGAPINMKAKELVDKILLTITSASSSNIVERPEENEQVVSFEDPIPIEMEENDVSMAPQQELQSIPSEESRRSSRRPSRRTFSHDNPTSNLHSERRSRFNATYALRSSTTSTSNQEIENRSSSIPRQLGPSEASGEGIISRTLSGRPIRKKRFYYGDEDEDGRGGTGGRGGDTTMISIVENKSINESNDRRRTRSSSNQKQQQDNDEDDDQQSTTHSRRKKGRSNRYTQKNKSDNSDDEEDEDEDENSEESEEEEEESSENEASERYQTRQTRNRTKRSYQDEEEDYHHHSYRHHSTSNKQTDKRRCLRSSSTFESPGESAVEQISTRRNSRTQSLKVQNQMITILDKAKELDWMQIFHYPVDIEQVPDYPLVISNPMDFETIRTNISKNKYQTMEQFHEDLMLIYTNCETYNDDHSEIFKESKRQRKEMKKIFHLYADS